MTKFPLILGLMVQAAEVSARIIRENFRKNTSYTDKNTHIDIVTQTDFQSQESIRELLTLGMKKLGFKNNEIGFIEEESASDCVRTHNFIVDPIDGTSNFASGIPYLCISIGYAINHEMKIGVVIEPFSQTLYWGEVGKGSFVKNDILGKRQLHLQAKPMKSWTVGAHLNGLDVVNNQFLIYQDIYSHVRGLRNMGSLTLDLCFMADNVFDAILNKGCYFWDLAATSVILAEANGEIYDFNGQMLRFDWVDTKRKYHIIACHPENVNEILKYIK